MPENRSVSILLRWYNELIGIGQEENLDRLAHPASGGRMSLHRDEAVKNDMF
jgi:hypothetical protein